MPALGKDFRKVATEREKGHVFTTENLEIAHILAKALSVFNMTPDATPTRISDHDMHQKTSKGAYVKTPQIS